MDFILQNLPMLIALIVGIVLLVVEALMPGFGLPGVSGVALLGVAIYLTWSNYGSLAGIGATLAVLALAGICVTLTLRSASSGRLSRTALVLKGTSSKEEGYAASEDLSKYMGMEGVALTVLRPSGIASFGGQRVNVVSRGEFIEKQAAVRVVETEGARVVVQKVS